MKSCIVYKCIKPEGSEDFTYLLMDKDRLLTMRLLKVWIKRQFTAPR
jgi:hypothetical protein